MAFPGRDVADALARLGTRIRDEAVWSRGEAARLGRIGMERLRGRNGAEQPLKRPRIRRAMKPVTMIKVSCLSFLGTMAVTLLVAGGTGVGPASVRFWSNDKVPSTNTENAAGGSTLAPPTSSTSPQVARTNTPAVTATLPAGVQSSSSVPRTTTSTTTRTTSAAPLPTTSSAPTTSEPDHTTSAPSSTTTAPEPPVETTTTAPPEEPPSATETTFDPGTLLPTAP